MRWASTTGALSLRHGRIRSVACMDGESFRRRWSTCGQMDEKKGWRRVEKGEREKEEVIDLLDEWQDTWWRQGSAKPVECVG